MAFAVRVGDRLLQLQHCFTGCEKECIALAAGEELHTRVGLTLVAFKAERQFAEVAIDLRWRGPLRGCGGEAELRREGKSAWNDEEGRRPESTNQPGRHGISPLCSGPDVRLTETAERTARMPQLSFG